MRLVFTIALLCLMPDLAPAQDTSAADEDKGFLTNWLETNLSGAGREVRIEGFKGALSSTASLEKLTIADDQGIWITLEDATLNWDRSALLRGNLDVTELSAGSIELVRWPDTEPAQPSPEASEFKLPDLPVAIQIGKIAVESVTLGEAILGDEASVSLDGSVELVSGEGRADISIVRIDDKNGALNLAAAYSNATEVLDLSLNVEEAEDGILVNSLNIPDRPSVSLTVEGAGPTSDLTTNIALSTNAAPRVTGAVRLTSEVTPDAVTTKAFEIDLLGDIAPLLAEQYRAFVDGRSELYVSGALLPDKRFEINRFHLKSAAMELSGTLTLSEDGLPEAFNVIGSIAPVDGPDVVLPISGAETRISSALISAAFKAGESDKWSVNANFLGLKQDGITIADGVLRAEGLIQRVGSGATASRRITAKINSDLVGIELSDRAMAEALGETVTATATLDWQEGGPLRLGFLDLVAGDLSVSGSGTIDGFDTNFRIAGDLTAAAPSLERFSAFANRPLAGAAEVRVDGWFQPLGGAFDGEVEGNTINLRLGNDKFLDLVEGDGSFAIDARRDTGGLHIETFSAQTPAISAEIDGMLRTNASDLRASLSLADVATLVEGISGPAQLSGTVKQAGPDWTIDLAGSGPGGSSIATRGIIRAELDAVDLDMTGSIPIGLANTFLSPATDIQGTASFDLAMSGVPSLGAISGTISTSNARISAPTLRAAIRNIDASANISQGVANIAATGRFSSGGRITVDGSLGLTPSYAADLRIGLVNAEFADPPTYTTTANGALTLRGQLLGAARLEGRIELEETEIRLAPTTFAQGVPDIKHVNDSSAVMRTRVRAGLEETNGDGQRAGAARSIGLDIVIDAPSRIFIRGRGLDAELGGTLRITGTTTDVIPIGQFNLVRGRLDILGKRLEMREALLQLRGSFDPTFRMVASTETTNATVRIITEGTPQAPSITFESDPDLPDDEILANLLFGRDINSISPLQAAQLASAVATLAGSGGEGIIGRIRNQFNLDDLDVTTDDEGAAALRVGKYLSENIYTDIEVNSEGRSEINLNLDITPNITAKGSVGSDGDTGLGIFFERDY